VSSPITGPTVKKAIGYLAQRQARSRYYGRRAIDSENSDTGAISIALDILN
jgi:hypothetical protein